MPRVRYLFAAVALSVVTSPMAASRAEDASKMPVLTDPSGFERAYATSFYDFDACGAELTGRIFRDVLAQKFAMCPFSADARARYQRWTGVQRRKASAHIKEMIIQYGGLPTRLDGMKTTCHEQTTSAAFQGLQSQLDGFQRGAVTASAILPAPCDSTEITP